MQNETRSSAGRRILLMLKAAGVGLLVLFLVAALAILYMVRCEGHWDGATIEDLGTVELCALRDNLRSDVAYMSGLGPRNSTSPRAYEQLRACEEWLVQRWNSLGRPVRRQTFSVEGREYSNLEIELQGRIVPSEIVIISAQYDTLPDSPGANNNASGVAVVLRLSELLRDFKPERTLRLVLFTNEEDPFLGTEKMGSYVYAERASRQKEDVRIMLSLDSIGIYENAPGTQNFPFPFSFFYPDRGNFLAFIANLPSRKWARSATRGFRRGTTFPVRAGAIPEWVEGATWSDHSSFWRFGYPAIQVTDTGACRSPYHTTQYDTMEKMDFDALARVTVGMYGTILELTRKDDSSSRHGASSTWLMFNGTIVLLAGLLSGFPFWLAIVRNKAEQKVRAWRVAHSFLAMDGIMTIVIALVVPRLAIGEGGVSILVFSLIASGYAFTTAFIVGAWKGIRGLTPVPWGLNILLFLCHLVGVLGCLAGGSILAYGLFEAL